MFFFLTLILGSLARRKRSLGKAANLPSQLLQHYWHFTLLSPLSFAQIGWWAHIWKGLTLPKWIIYLIKWWRQIWWRHRKWLFLVQICTKNLHLVRKELSKNIEALILQKLSLSSRLAECHEQNIAKCITINFWKENLNSFPTSYFATWMVIISPWDNPGAP